MSDKNVRVSIEDTPMTNEQRIWWWKILIATYFSYGGFYLCRKVFSICKTSIADTLGVGIDMVGYLYLAYLVAYMAGQLCNSFIGRKWGPRVLLLGGLGLSMIFNVIFGFANSYHTFLIFMIFNGLVQACGWPGCVGGVAHWLRKKDRGTIMGFWSTNYLIGSIMVKGLGGFLLLYTNNLIIFGHKLPAWRYTFFGCTLAAFVIWWLIYIWQRDKPEDVGLPPIVDKDYDEDRAVNATNDDKITFKSYLTILLNPVVPIMGLAYFCLKFLRYSLDSWTPTFLTLLGLSTGKSAWWSMIFDFIGLPGAILAGILLDRLFRGKWFTLCLIMGIGLVIGYAFMLKYGSNPYVFAILAGYVGFMLYGPDTIVNGTAAVQVAGERNAVAVAGLVNGLGSIGSVIQELVIARAMKNFSPEQGVHFTNMLGFWMSVFFVFVMFVITLTITRIQKRNALSEGRA